MKPDLISLQLDPDVTRPHQALPPRRPPPPQPAIVGIMAHATQWFGWLVANALAFFSIYTVKGSDFDWERAGLFFLSMMLIIGWIAVKEKGAWILGTAILALYTVALVVML